MRSPWSVPYIVSAVNQDPVALGLVASLARAGGNATGVNDFRLPGGPPLPLAPPCNRQRPFPPSRLLAPI
jgi:hypothetical protein